MIDGCGPLKIFSKIVIPLSKPMLATMTLFSFVGYWNTYFNSVMYITSTAKQTLQVYVQKIVLSSTVADVVDLSTGDNSSSGGNENGSRCSCNHSDFDHLSILAEILPDRYDGRSCKRISWRYDIKKRLQGSSWK